MLRWKDLKYDLALLFAVLVWGVNFVVIKAALAVMPAHVMNVFRFLVSASVLGALYAAQQRRAGQSFVEPMRTHGRSLFALGMLGFLFYQVCFIVGVDHTTAGNAALIMAGAPLWTALLGHFLGFDVMKAGGWLGLVLTFVGAAVIVVGGAGEIDLSDDTFFGNVLMTAGAVLWGAYTAFSKPLSRHVTPLSISFLGLLCALPFLLALGAYYLGEVAWERVTLWIWAAILFSGGLSIGIAVVIWNTAVRNVGPSQTAVYGNLVPVVALVSGALLLGEPVLPAQLAGGALILLGLVLMRRSRQPRAVQV